MTVRELREKYLRFFEEKGHENFPSGSLVPIDVTGRVDESLLFTGAGMIQFKPYFRGTSKAKRPRLTTCQKCLRTGDIEAVGDSTHLTFFEMLGNFSFGDYFKREAIAFSWEFITDRRWLGLDPTKIAATIFESDDEAFESWSQHYRSVAISPESRIFRLGEDTNYWPAGALSHGPPGPCGPNSEMFYWTGPGAPPTTGYAREDYLRDEAKGLWVEFWNDVFIQFEWKGHKEDSGAAEGYVRDSLDNLPFRSIDTGMGVERTALALGGYSDLYEIDSIKPIVFAIEGICARQGVPSSYAADPRKDRAFRVITDHGRAASFCIADGVLPGNTGRGYVLRRLIRRAILQGRKSLGLSHPFLPEVAEGIKATMVEFYPELSERNATILETLQSEEELFERTLAAGSHLLTQQLEELGPGDTLPGDAAFQLYDTFGFPLEVTREIAGEQGVGIDENGYKAALARAQSRSRSGQARETVYGGLEAVEQIHREGAPDSTEFVGYERLEDFGEIVRIRPKTDVRAWIALDRTPFYAESGGQVGDEGVLEYESIQIQVLNTTKSSGTYWHEAALQGTPEEWLGRNVRASVDSSRRAKIARNHTATHLLHATLRRVLGTHVTQAGSHVGPEGLRFDFTHAKALAPDQVREVETIVNQKVLENIAVATHVDILLSEARSLGAMALFGEKYGDRVRMVQIGEFSKELCGGTHTKASAEIGLFKIVSEGSAAGGIRRIEAITGEGAVAWAFETEQILVEVANLLKVSPKDVVTSVTRALELLKEERKKREHAERLKLTSTSGQGEEVEVGGLILWTRNFGDADPKMVANALDAAVADRHQLVGIGVTVSSEGKILFSTKVGPFALQRGAHAGNLVKEVASVAGGSGGGRAEFASAGGKDASKIGEALLAAQAALRRQIGE